MKRDKIVRNQLKRLKTNHRKNWHHLNHKNDDYLCPYPFFNNDCINIFKSKFFNKSEKNDIYRRVNRTFNSSVGK